MAFCAQCGTRMADGAPFCPHCGIRSNVGTGVSAGPVRTFCPQCGTRIAPGAVFCPQCGTRIAQNADASFSQRSGVATQQQANSTSTVVGPALQALREAIVVFGGPGIAEVGEVPGKGETIISAWQGR